MTTLEESIFEELENLPAPDPRKPHEPLAAVRLVWLCTHAAEAARDEIADDKGTGVALATLTRIVGELCPHEDDDETEDAWYRRGAVSGAISAWTKLIYIEPKDAPSFDHAVLHANGWLLANMVTLEVING